VIGVLPPLRKDWGDTPLVEIGRQMVAAGQHDSESMVECVALIEYYKAQRQRFRDRGQCAGRCEVTKIVSNNGAIVCPHTFEPCNREKLQSVVSLWSVVNK